MTKAVIVLLVLLCITCISSLQKSLKYFPIRTLDDDSASGYELFVSVGKQSVLECLVACSNNDKCRSIFYSKISKRCQHNTVAFIYRDSGIYWNDQPGSRYYELYHEDCPRSMGYIYSEHPQLCIRIYKPERKDWYNARLACKEQGGDLLVIDTIEKYNYIIQAMMPYRYWYHVGGSDLNKTGVWYWVNGALLPNNSSLWAPNEPSPLQHTTALRWDGKLDANDDFAVRSYVCEINVN